MLSIVIPVYNEPSLPELLRRVRAVNFPIPVEIIVVDDCSTDGTREWIAQNARHLNIKAVFQDKNRGKGSSLREGFAIATGDIIVVQDGDIEYDPNDLAKMVQAMLKSRASVVYGSRRINSNNKQYSRFLYYLGGNLLTVACNLLFGTKITDEATCYKMFDARLLKSIPLRCQRFEFCPEVTAKLAKRGHHITEVPISYTPRNAQEGKKIRWQDGFIAIWTLIKYRFMD